MAGNTVGLPVSGDEEPWPPFSSTPPETGEIMREYTARVFGAPEVIMWGRKRMITREGVVLGLARFLMPYALVGSQN